MHGKRVLVSPLSVDGEWSVTGIPVRLSRDHVRNSPTFNPQEPISAEIEEKLEIRRVKHPQWRIEPTAGSYFKNLPPGFQAPGLPLSPGTRRVPAGVLLDACDCRGLRVGDAMVFAKHANILVNAGRATAHDVLTLAEVMKARVRAKFGVELEEEVMFLGARPDVSAAAAQSA